VITLRRLSVDDWRLWRQLRLEALTEAPYAFSATLADWQGEGDTEERWRGRLSSVAFNLIADLDETPAGMVSATAADAERIIELISMWVAPIARGRGVGDLLVKAVIAWATEQAASKIALAVAEGNVHASGLYRRHNFMDSGGPGNSRHFSGCERQMFREL